MTSNKKFRIEGGKAENQKIPDNVSFHCHFLLMKIKKPIPKNSFPQITQLTFEANVYMLNHLVNTMFDVSNTIHYTLIRACPELDWHRGGLRSTFDRIPVRSSVASRRRVAQVVGAFTLSSLGYNEPFSGRKMSTDSKRDSLFLSTTRKHVRPTRRIKKRP